VAKAAQEHPIATNSPLAYGYGEDGLRKKKLPKVSRTKGSPYEVDNDFTMSQSSRDDRKNLELEDGDDFIEEDESGLDEPRRLKEADSPSSVKVEGALKNYGNLVSNYLTIPYINPTHQD
jgi:hypothetical protein